MFAAALRACPTVIWLFHGGNQGVATVLSGRQDHSLMTREFR